MESVNKTVNYVQNLPRTKKLILIVMIIIIILFLIDLFRTYNKQVNQPKKNSNVEKLDTNVLAPQNNVNNETDGASQMSFGDLTLDTEKINITLYFAHWCGHCKTFINSTWSKAKETYANSNELTLNEVDCTNTKTEVKTPAGKTIQGFPTVILNYKNKDGEYVEEEYNGGRSYSVFSAFLENFSSKM